MEEMFDVYTRDGKYMGIKLKSFCHSSNPQVYHKPVWIWIVNEKGEILVQKRADCKKSSPGLYDMPSAGHVHSGESIIDGCVRETYEELGIRFDANRFQFIEEYIYDKSWELAQVYLLKVDISECKFRLEHNEVAEVKWLTFEEFKKFIYSKYFVVHTIDYKDEVIKILENNI